MPGLSLISVPNPEQNPDVCQIPAVPAPLHDPELDEPIKA